MSATEQTNCGQAINTEGFKALESTTEEVLVGEGHQNSGAKGKLV